MTLPSEQLYPEKPRKTCAKCRDIYDLDDFPIDLKHRDGHSSWCRPCTRFYYSKPERRKRKLRSKPLKFNVDGEPVKICPNKTCLHHRTLQLLDNFDRDSSRSDGHNSHCKDCTRPKNQEYKKDNHDKMIADSRQRYAEDTKRGRQTAKQWRINNPEKVKDGKKKYRENYPEASNVDYLRQRKKELSQVATSVLEPLWARRITWSCRHRASEKQAPFDMKPSDLLDKKTGLLPVFCPIFPFIKLDYSAGPNRRRWASVDRIVPVLGYVTGNVMVMSFAANLWKSDGSDAEERKRIVAIMNGRKKKKEPRQDQPSLFD